MAHNTTAEPDVRTTNDRLDVVIGILERMNRRERHRQIAGFFRGIITLVPTVLFLWSILYLYQNWDALTTEFLQEAMRQAMQFGQ